MFKLLLEILGDFHPLIVHFPIGIFGLIAISLVLSKIGKIELPMSYFRLTNCFCLFTLILAVAFGLASENSRAYSGNDALLLEWHEQLGFGTLATYSLACLFLFLSSQRKSFFNYYLIFFVFSFLLISIGGHFGSTIVRGEITLIKLFYQEKENNSDSNSSVKTNTPEPILTSKVIAVDFESQIKPIFEENCYKCHGEKKQKGKLRLDTNDFKKIIEPFEPEKSKLYELITLPEDNEDLMPPKDGPLTKESIQLIFDWIKQGAKTIPASKEIK